MKKIRVVIIGFLLAFLMTGCYKVNMTIDVHEDGSGNLGIEMLVGQTVLDYMETSSTEMIEGLKSGLNDQSEFEGAVFENIEKEIDGQKYYGFNLTVAMGEDKMKELVTVSSGKISFVISGEEMKEMSGGMQDDFQDESMDIEQMKQYGMEFNFTVKMPYKITKCEGATLSEDKMSAVVDLLTEENVDQVVIECKTPSAKPDLGLAIGAAAVLALVAAVVVVKKKA